MCGVLPKGYDYYSEITVTKIKVLTLSFADDDYDLTSELDWDVHVLAGSLKLFFRELNEPLVPYKFFDKFVKIIRECRL